MILKGILRKNEKTEIICLFFVSVLFFAFVSLCTPMASDDFEFRSLSFSGVADLLKYVFYYGNGRVLGNLGAIILVKNPILAAVVKALTISGVIFLVPAVLGIQSSGGYWLSFLLFSIIPAALFGEVYTWTCGFQNYIPPIWMTLVILLLLQKYHSLHTVTARALVCTAVFLLGFGGQLFTEHSSLINLFWAFTCVVRQYKKRNKTTPAVIWFCAAAIGFACMMLVPVVFYMDGNRCEGYGSVNLGSIVQLAVSCVVSFAGMGSAFPGLGLGASWISRPRLWP